MGKGSRNAARVLLFGTAMRSLPTNRSFATVLAFIVALSLGGCSASPDTAGTEGAANDGTQVPSTNAENVGNGDESTGDIGDDTPDGPMIAADDSSPIGTVHQGLVASAQMRTTANVNLRKGAGTTFAVLAVIPSGTIVTLLDPTAQNGFLQIEFSGTAGWSSATYLTAVASTGGGSTGGSSGAIDLEGAVSPDNAIARAKAAVGFSYYWGGGAWLPGGPTSSTKGSCSGSCPSCSHSGKYGADCSGLIAKAWQFGTKALESNSHPYSTASFVSDSSGHWSTVSRSSLHKGDALVYNSGGHGHIAMYEKGDGWGSPTVIECRGCSYGCVYNARSFASTYHGIRRSGF